MAMMTRMSWDIVLADIRQCCLAVPDAEGRLAGDDTHPLVASKGAGSIHVLRRRRGKGWQYLGYAVWSCDRQAWVCGSWCRPVDMADATAYLRGMRWEG